MDEISKEEMTRAVNTQPRLLVLARMTLEDGTILPVISLPPGGSDIEVRRLAALDALDPRKGLGKVWRSWLELGWVKLDDAAPLGVASPATLDSYSDKGALALVAAEASAETLTRWASTESRGDVTAAINVRLAALAKGES